MQANAGYDGRDYAPRPLFTWVDYAVLQKPTIKGDEPYCQSIVCKLDEQLTEGYLSKSPACGSYEHASSFRGVFK